MMIRHIRAVLALSTFLLALPGCGSGSSTQPVADQDEVAQWLEQNPDENLDIEVEEEEEEESYD